MTPTAAPPPDFARRLGEVRARLERGGVSGLFLPESADLEYLTGIPRAVHEADRAWDPYELVNGCFIGLETGPLFVLSRGQWAGEIAPLVAGTHGLISVPMDGDVVSALREGASASAIGAVLAVGAWTPLRQLDALRGALPDTRLIDATEFILPSRLSKDEYEIARIRRAGEIVEEGLDRTLARLSAPIQKRDLLHELRHQLLLAGAHGMAYGPDIHAVGPSTDIDWMTDCLGEMDSAITAPAAISIDMGVVFHGYRSDIGRTVFVGEPLPGAERALRIAQAAQAAAIDAVRPGALAESVDAASRALVDRAGFGPAFSIPSGHGIGLDLHEPPRFRAGIRDLVPDNAVVTVEIGLWAKGEVSAFWEDEVVARADGPERLTSGHDAPLII